VATPRDFAWRRYNDIDADRKIAQDAHDLDGSAAFVGNSSQDHQQVYVAVRSRLATGL
jgi:hypothetical protein